MKLILCTIAMLITSPAFADQTKANCSRALFPNADGGGQSISVKMESPSQTETARLIQEITDGATESQHGKQGCADDVPSCYGSDGRTYYDLIRIRDSFTRLLGINGSSTVQRETYKTPLGWTAYVTETYTCSWSSKYFPLCERTCNWGTESAPGW